MTEPIHGLVGRGRVASHLARYLELENIPFASWHRGSGESPEEALGRCPVLLLAVSDDALEPFLAAHPSLAGPRVIHFSGSRTVPGAWGFHPLYTFGPRLYGLDEYRSIPFVTEAGGPALRDVFPGLANPSVALDPAKKGLYHALCVMAGNFTTLLWSKLLDDFPARLGLSRDIAVPYLERTARNALEQGSAALTGPLARRDAGTVEVNLAALDGDPYAAVYRAFAGMFGLAPGAGKGKEALA